MSREILFKGKKIEENEWIEGYPLEWNDKTYICIWAYGGEIDSYKWNPFFRDRP